jgi:glyoxylase-like metal-dependent hydrolase (beta-lactamase superfamily II)
MRQPAHATFTGEKKEMIVPQESRHFQLHALAEGVYAAIAAEDGAAYSNAGIIDMGGRTLIFDTFDNPLAAQDLKQIAERLTGQAAFTVINSHYHPDHWSGNQVFAGRAEIIATHATRHAMQEVAEHFRSSDQVLREIRDRLLQNEEKLLSETEETRRKALQASITRQRFDLETLPTLRLHLPNQTFEGRLVFQGAKRRADLVATGSGHTTGDCILLLENENIAFLADLAFFHMAPFMGDCIPADWLKRIEEIKKLNLRQIVPGHGGLGTLSDLELEAQYIHEIQALAAGVIQAGGSERDAYKLSLPAPFDTWTEMGAARYHSNLRRIFQIGVMHR